MICVDQPGLNKMLAEGTDQSSMGFDGRVRNANTHREQGRVRCVEHGVISAIARAFGVVHSQKDAGGRQGAFRFFHVDFRGY